MILVTCLFCHNTTLQDDRLPSVTTIVTREKIRGELPRTPLLRTSVNKGKRKGRGHLWRHLGPRRGLGRTVTPAIVLPLPRCRCLADRRPHHAASFPASRRSCRSGERSPCCPTRKGLRLRLGRRRCARVALPWSRFAPGRSRVRRRPASTSRNPLPYDERACKA